MPPPTSPRPALRLTRRGRLVRSVLLLLLAVLLILALVAVVRALGAGPAPEAQGAGPAGTTSAVAATDGAPTGDDTSPAADDGSSPTAAAPVAAAPDTDGGDGDGEMVRTGTVGDGTWQIAAAVEAPEGTTGTVHTYAVRVEGGTGIDADTAAREIADVLADDRGWQDLEDVTFQQVAESDDAQFTISVASPPTVDELCLPARTGGLWSCRIGPDVALNSDRWLHATPTFEDLAEYRAYMINHEVGHFLGHGHASCGGEGSTAPVMLQQSIDLQGCRPNAWPAHDG